MIRKISMFIFCLQILPCASRTLRANDAMPLSLRRAVEIALSSDGNARLRLARENELQVKAESLEARAALLPTLGSTLGAQSLTRSLAAEGLQFKLPIQGFTLPDFVGPFTVYDFRSSVSVNIFDLAASRRFRAAKGQVSVADAEVSSTQDQIISQVAQLYVAALRSDAALEVAQADTALAEALLKLAAERQAAGDGTGIEVTRAKVQLADRRQSLLALQTDRNRAHRQLLIALRMKANTQLSLTTKLASAPVEKLTLEGALKTAWDNRADLRAQEGREKNSRLTDSAVGAEKYPTVQVFADYGATGTSGGHTLPTYSAGVNVKVPILDGGLREAHREESLSGVRQEEVRTQELRDEIEFQVGQALDDLHSTEQQMAVAREGLALAESELAQARRRTKAGVADSLEIIDAQTRLVRARNNQVDALYSYHQARIEFGEATGTILTTIQNTPD